jgi:hypothetical protein
MRRYETFRQQVQRNIVALISVFIAVSSLSYNTWRNEKTELNRNLRQGSFEVLLKLGELRELVYHLEYDRAVTERSAERTGWVTVFVIRDLASVLEEPVPAAAESLYDAWAEHWDGLAQRNEKGELDGTSRRAIEAEIDRLRDMTLEMLQGLE